MASIQVQCEMCCTEHAVGCCNTCGNIGESCFEIHKTGRAFTTHILKMYGKDGYNPRRIMYDITEEICKYHPTERAFLFCKIHDTMICGRCLYSDHLSCGNEIVDLCHEARHIDYDQVNAMTAALSDITDDIKRMKVEADRKNATSKTHAVKCNKEMDDLEKKMKGNVEDLIKGFRQEACTLIDRNTYAYSCISSVCEDKSVWVDKEERQIDDIVTNSLTGNLYVMSRNFDKRISEVKREMQEAEYKHTFKQVCLHENKVALKCLTEDLRDVCELTDDVDGSDELTTHSVGSADQETQKTRKELIEALMLAKLDADKAKKRRNRSKKESLKAKQSLERSEKTRKELSDEVKQVKQELDNSEKARLDVELDLKRTIANLDRVKMEKAIVQAKFSHIKEIFNLTQPTGTVEVKTSSELGYPIIKFSFTFQDGIQTKHHSSSGKAYKGGLFTGRLSDDSAGKLVCGMLKAAFRRGRMFTIGINGKVVLDGVSLYNDAVYVDRIIKGLHLNYAEYISTVKAELAVKGITEEAIDQMEKLYETFTVDGLSFLEVALNS